MMTKPTHIKYTENLILNDGYAWVNGVDSSRNGEKSEKLLWRFRPSSAKRWPMMDFFFQFWDERQMRVATVGK